VKRGGLAGLGITTAEMLAQQDAFAEPVSGTVASQAKSILDSAIETIKQLAPAYIGIQQAKTCLQINADRARNGLPPMDCASGGLAPQVGIGVSPDVKMILWAALGIGALFLFMRKR
jgi:hypothetical protein